MGTYKIPYQDLSISIPDENQIFKLPGGAYGEIGIRIGNQIFTTSYMGLGTGTDKGTILATGEKAYRDLGIDYNSLPTYNYGDLMSLQGYFVPGGNLTANMLKQYIGKPTGISENITQNISPDNPQGIIVTNQAGQVISKSPSTAESLASAGATPEQIAQIQAGNVSGALASTPFPPMTGGTANPPAPIQAPTQAPTQNPIQAVQAGTANAETANAGVTTAGAPAGTTSTTTPPKTLEDYMAMLQAPEGATEKQYKEILGQYQGLLPSLAKKGSEQLAAEQAAKIPQMQADLAEINGEILTAVAEYEALKIDIEGKPITMASIIGSQAQIEKKKVSDIMLLQARAMGLQGQLTSAQNTVNRAIDLKYSVIETTLQIYESQLNALTPLLNKEENLIAQVQQLMIEDKRQEVADAKAAEVDIQKVMLLAAQSGVPNNILSQISESSTYEQAMQLAAPYIGGTQLPLSQPNTGDARTKTRFTML